jgi:hypothetical protein
MHHKYLAQLDKDWLRDSISGKEIHLKNVNGAIGSEVISDLFVLFSGGLTVAFSIASQSLVPLAVNPLPMVQLALAYKTIASLMKQRAKIMNDLHVLNAILEIDKETPENITAMVHDYIEIHGDPDNDSHPSHLEVKTLSPEALRTIQRNFRQKSKKTSLARKAITSVSFLKNEFTNAASMVGRTILTPVSLGKSVFSSIKNIKDIYKNWDEIKESRSGDTLRETYNTMLRRAHNNSDQNDMPKEVGSFFSNERKNQLYYLHQQQASLRTVSQLRVDTAKGFGACVGIIGIALWSAATSTTAGALIGSLYTIVASLPSLKVLGDELNDLTKTSNKYSPRVDKAAAEFLMGIPAR